MKGIILFFALVLFTPATLQAENVFRQQNDAQNVMNPKAGCQNPSFGFTPKEQEICIGVYQSCMRSDFKQYERDRCLMDAVQKGAKASSAVKAGENVAQKTNSQAPEKGQTIELSFTPYQAYDLIELCEQKPNKNKPLCSGAVLPNKAKIMTAIKTARH